nr:AlNc14C214G8969 [Albugo laibachii Nc14]|eukprot:CCA23930.1 AlNc14C214G8969 [Albugo laibachii Nc14]
MNQIQMLWRCFGDALEMLWRWSHAPRNMARFSVLYTAVLVFNYKSPRKSHILSWGCRNLSNRLYLAYRITGALYFLISNFDLPQSVILIIKMVFLRGRACVIHVLIWMTSITRSISEPCIFAAPVTCHAVDDRKAVLVILDTLIQGARFSCKRASETHEWIPRDNVLHIWPYGADSNCRTFQFQYLRGRLLLHEKIKIANNPPFVSVDVVQDSLLWTLPFSTLSMIVAGGHRKEVSGNIILLSLGIKKLLLPTAHFTELPSMKYQALVFNINGASLSIDLKGVDVGETSWDYFVFGTSVMNQFEINLLRVPSPNITYPKRHIINFSTL